MTSGGQDSPGAIRTIAPFDRKFSAIPRAPAPTAPAINITCPLNWLIRLSAPPNSYLLLSARRSLSGSQLKHRGRQKPEFGSRGHHRDVVNHHSFAWVGVFGFRAEARWSTTLLFHYGLSRTGEL